jgi:predicted ABC-type ATPase
MISQTPRPGPVCELVRLHWPKVMANMREAKTAGYGTAIVYVAPGNPDLHIERVRLGVSRGGHDIPDRDIRRRYARSLDR